MSAGQEAAQVVLIVEDERPIADLLGSYLARDGFEVALARTGEDALRDLAALHPAAVILDVGLPGIDGIEVCRRMRAAGDATPVLFVTARDDEVDRVLGLELGADDYVTKPFSPREVVARVRAVLRRVPAGPSGAVDDVLSVGAVRLDAGSRKVEADGVPVPLTTTEFDLLRHLMGRPGRVFPREELLADVWGYPPGTPTRTLDVHVAQLRAKLGAALDLRTVRGVGYSVERSERPS
ncbi:response regulator transcription factor [Spongisporangium articulatum]|uniref:Response regulator transcription factor n=1 Tax=Spongisporangium articulatum TaxID=3362603 RepID=A0ABW8ANV1_9ACTN